MNSGVDPRVVASGPKGRAGGAGGAGSVGATSGRAVPWRPLPRDPSDELPRPLAEGLETIAQRFGVGRPSVLAVIFGRWDHVAGAVLARHCRPTGLRAGVLYIEAEDAAWAQEVQFNVDQLRSNLAELLGETGAGDVRRIEVKAVRPSSSRRVRPSDDV